MGALGKSSSIFSAHFEKPRSVRPFDRNDKFRFYDSLLYKYTVAHRPTDRTHTYTSPCIRLLSTVNFFQPPKSFSFASVYSYIFSFFSSATFFFLLFTFSQSRPSAMYNVQWPLRRNGIIFQYGRTDDTGSVIVDVFGINVLASGHGKCE